MEFLSLSPFVPSGPDFETSRQLFIEIGFQLNWDNGGYAGFGKDGCTFILQHYDQKDFAENFMLTVGVPDVKAFREMVLSKDIPARFGVRIGEVTIQPYGKEVNMVDIAGVCWHFVE